MSKEIQKKNKTNNNTVKKKLDFSNVNSKALAKSLEDLSIPRLFHQLVVFILDASESMTWEGISGKSKGEEIKSQIIPIIERLRSSKNENSFDIAMYAFSHGFKEFISTTPPKDIDLNSLSLNPCEHIENQGTFAEPVFLEVEKKIENYLKKHKTKSAQAMIVFLGDGAIHDYPKVLKVCERIRKDEKVTILSYLLEDKGWKQKYSVDDLNFVRENIKTMSSKDSNGINFFESKVDPEEIRKHMIKSISTISKIN